MSEFKNLKVPKRTHDLLVSRAESLGMKVYTLANALLVSGLLLNTTAIQQAVADAQQDKATQPGANTTQARRRQK